jgi:hypothetical protein
LNPTLCHRDVKSFNFLGTLTFIASDACNVCKIQAGFFCSCVVDSQLNAKIADLELGSKSVQMTFAAANRRNSQIGTSNEQAMALARAQAERQKELAFENIVSNVDDDSRATVGDGEAVEEGRDSEYDGDIVVVEDLLANWIAPEVCEFKVFRL